MKLFLAKGMFGEKRVLLAESDDKRTIFAEIEKWKNDEINRKRFKIEPYCRMITKNDETAVDFGDYSWFMLISRKKEND